MKGYQRVFEGLDIMNKWLLSHFAMFNQTHFVESQEENLQNLSGRGLPSPSIQYEGNKHVQDAMEGTLSYTFSGPLKLRKTGRINNEGFKGLDLKHCIQYITENPPTHPRPEGLCLQK